MHCCRSCSSINFEKVKIKREKIHKILQQLLRNILRNLWRLYGHSAHFIFMWYIFSHWTSRLHIRNISRLHTHISQWSLIMNQRLQLRASLALSIRSQEVYAKAISIEFVSIINKRTIKIVRHTALSQGSRHWKGHWPFKAKFQIKAKRERQAVVPWISNYNIP